MATGGDLRSTADGTDEDFVNPCTPCGVGDIKVEATQYCPECKEYLCKGCTEYHGRLKATCSHKLQDRASSKISSMSVMTKKCPQHPDRDIELYCEEHETVCCTRCIDKEHRYCIKVLFADEITQSIAEDTQTKLLQDKVSTIRDRLAGINKRKHEYIDSIQSQRHEILNKIQEQEQSFIDHLTKLKAELTNKLDRKHDETKEEHLLEINRVTHIMKKLEEAKTNLQSVTTEADIEAIQKFKILKSAQKTVTDAEHIYDEWEFNGKKSLCLKESTTLNTFKTEVTLGEICNVVEPRNKSKRCVLKSVEKLDTKQNVYMNDLCLLPDGTLMLANNANKVNWFDANYKIKGYCNLGASPISICCIGRNEVAVKMNTNQILFISTGVCLSKRACITLRAKYDGSRLVHRNGRLLVSLENGIALYNMSGNLLRCINENATVTIEHKLSGYMSSAPKAIALTGENVIITNFNKIDGAVCLREDGTIIRYLRHENLKNTYGVCVSTDGTVFLLGSSSNNIVMFDVDGKCVGEYSLQDTEMKWPKAICYDDKRNCILVVGWSNSLFILDICDI